MGFLEVPFSCQHAKYSCLLVGKNDGLPVTFYDFLLIIKRKITQNDPVGICPISSDVLWYFPDCCVKQD